MSLKFSQIQPLVSMVTDRVMMGKRCLHFFYKSKNKKKNKKKNTTTRPTFSMLTEKTDLMKHLGSSYICILIVLLHICQNQGLSKKDLAKTHLYSLSNLFGFLMFFLLHLFYNLPKTFCTCTPDHQIREVASFSKNYYLLQKQYCVVYSL